MYSHLTKKEKQKKLAQIRKRAILWSAQQQTQSGLWKSTSRPPQPSLNKPNLHLKQDQSLKSSEVSFSIHIPLTEQHTYIVQAIQQILVNLQRQKRSTGHYNQYPQSTFRLSTIYFSSKMNNTDTDFGMKSISFFPKDTSDITKILEVKYTCSGITFKTQLPIFKEGNAEEFLHYRVKSQARIYSIQKT